MIFNQVFVKDPNALSKLEEDAASTIVAMSAGDA